MTAPTQDRPILAAGLIIFCMFIVSLSDNFILYISDDFGLWQYHAVRSSIAVVGIWIVGSFLGWSFIPKNKGAVLARSILYSMGMMLYFAALGEVPVPQAAAGLFTAPIFVLIFTVVAFRNPIGFWRIFAVLLGFGGALLVLKPVGSEFSIIALLPMIGAAFYALGLLVTRYKCADEKAPVLVFWFMAVAGLYGYVGGSVFEWVTPVLEGNQTYITRGWDMPSGFFIAITVLASVITVVALTAQARGYQMADASYLAVFEYTFLVSAAFWGWIMWGQTLDALSILGMVFIAISGTIIAVRSKNA